MKNPPRDGSRKSSGEDFDFLRLLDAGFCPFHTKVSVVYGEVPFD
jgi:hypothetical protein